MAKKKKADSTGEPSAVSAHDVINRMKKNFGDEIFVRGRDIVEDKKRVIPVSPKIDYMLGGGIPEGSVVVSTGPPKVGKTTMCLHAASIAQRPENNSKYGPRHVFFHNIEMRLKERDLRGIHGLDLDNQFTSIESKPKNIITGEKHVEIALQWFHEVPGCIVIFDSFSSLLTQGRMDNEIGKRFRDDAPSLLSDFLRRAAPVIVTNNCILMGVTHMISNQSPMSKSPWIESSGRKLQYACDVKLKATHFTPWKSGSGDDSEQIGQDVHWKCDWSALGPPGTECQSKLRYGYGIDKEAELIDICSELAIIKKGGAWFTFPNELKFQGLENARNYLVDNPDVYLDLYKQYRELLGFKNED